MLGRETIHQKEKKIYIYSFLELSPCANIGENEPQMEVGVTFLLMGILFILANPVVGWVRINHDSNLEAIYYSNFNSGWSRNKHRRIAKSCESN